MAHRCAIHNFMRNRLISILLCIVLVLSLLPAVTVITEKKAYAATASQNNIVARADYFYNLTWTCQSTVYGWNYNYTFYAGSTYRVPYGQPINSGAYVGYYVSIENFLAAANTPGSVFYTSRSSYDSTSSVYYATDCSAFVSWCWGVDRKTTYSIPQISTYIGMATASNAYSLQLGDCLNSNDVGHVVLVTDLVYSGNTLTSIEITEQTPPQMKRSWYTPSELGAKYGSYYGIYRYSGTVPAAPDGSTNNDSGSSPGGSGSITSKYYPACGSSYGNLTEAFASIGVTLSWNLQTRIAEKNNISNYEGTVEQNTTLLNLLKAGTLLNPDYVPVSYYPACGSTYENLYDAFSSIGISLNWDLQVQIAAANGISGYEGTVEQNTTILNLLKAGKLIVPGSGSGDDSGSSGGSGGTVTDGKTGYDRGYAGGMAGSGEYKAFGLDVSSWQGASLNFNRIKNAGYDYVILRAGTTNGKDTCFETYYTNAKAAGLDVGVYYYSYATSVSAVKSDMEDFISYIAGKKYEYPVYFDYEDSTQQALSSSVSQQICLTAMDMLAAEGYLVGLYTGKYFSTQLPISTICAKYEIWIAHYLSSGVSGYDGTGDYWKYGPTYASQYGMYQFTDSVWINGYGPYDGDVCYKDYPAIVKQYGFNGYASSVQEEETYFDKCTYYPSHCTFTTTQATGIFSEPRTAKTGNTSVQLEAAPNGTTYTSIGLYVNSGGNIFYEVLTSNGQKGYIYSGYTTYGAPVTSDVKISGQSVPGNHIVGNTFVVSGTVSSTYNTLGKVSVYIYSGNSTTGTPVTGGYAQASNNKYSLSGSSIDDATSFGDLTVGAYTYVISADYTSYYAVTKNELGTTSGTAKLVTQLFNVVNSESETPENYFDKCTFYPSRCTFTTNRDTGIFSEPRTAKTGNTSVKLEDAPNGTEYTSIGLYVNSGGNIFYEVLTSTGQKGYIYSGYTEYGKKAYDDIKLSGASYPNAIKKGSSFVVSGTISSSYNTLGTATVYIYSGATTSGTPVTGGSGKVSNNKYVLANSAIDDATAFGKLSTGLYTYRIQVTFTSYYAASPTELGVNSGTRTLKTHYFTVISSSVSQSSCSHSNKTATAKAATCTDTGTLITYCTKCGLTEKSTIEATGHTYGSYVVTQAATCTQPGTKAKTCAGCGKVYTKEIAATGHNYQLTSTINSTCIEYAQGVYTCSGCGDSYTRIAGEYTDWSTSKPNVDSVLIETKTQYRYRDYSSLTSYEANLPGYTLVSNTWEKTGTGKVTYVKSWPSGFSTSSNTYANYNNSSKKVTASETATNKTTVNSDAIVGYLWYHWCSNSGSTSTSYETNSNWCFHVFYSTTTPSQANNYDSSDGSYKLSSSTQCAYCQWYWPVAVYEQNYTTYKNLFTYEQWSDWSEWSDTAISATDTRSVETRKVYRYIQASKGDHTWNKGSVTTAPTCTKSGVKTYTCTSCGETKTETVSALGHSWSNASCTKPSTCSTCGTTSGSALGHDYTSKVTTKATCTSDGVRTYTCSRCNNSYTESIPRLGHSYTSSVTAPTCTEQGYTTYTCTTCANSYKDNYTNAIGHSYTSQITTSAGCTTNGVITYTCKNCQYSYTQSIPASGHRYSTVVTAPGCTSQGYTTHICSACGNSYQDAFTEPKGHSYQGATCTNCGDVRDYYLIGYINGSNLGCNNDYANLGPYQFINGKVTLVASSDSYVFVKTGDNQNWYMTNGWDPSAKSVTLYNTSLGIDANKMFIPGGVTVILSLMVHDNDTLTLSYVIDSCTHNYTSQITTEPTCSSNGVRTFTCSICSDTYTETIEAFGHSYFSATTSNPTCEKDGVKTYTCSNCNHSYTEVIPATGHNYVGGKCNNCGSTKAVSLAGDFNGWDGQPMTWNSNGYRYNVKLSAGTYKFKVIKDGTWLGNNGEIRDTTTTTSDIGWEFADWGGDCTLVATGGTYTFTFNFDTNMLVIEFVHTHAYTAGEVVAPTCTAKGYTVYTCACGNTENRDKTTALGHDYNAVVTAPSCTAQGYTTHTCTRCNHSYVDSYVDPTDHSYTSKVTTAATCEKDGVMTYTCSKCSDSYTEVIDKLGHSYSSKVTAPTCTAEGYTTYDCSTCGDSYVSDKVAALGHDYNAVVTAPSCTAQGYTTHTCGTCGDSYVDSYVDPTGHSYTSMVTTAATCEMDGVMTFTCSKCADSYTAVINKLGHNYSAVVTAPTCTAQGYTTHTCGTCGDSYVDSYVDPTGHTWNNGICDCGAYALQALSMSLTLESEVKYNLYFNINDPSLKLENVGLLTYKSEPMDATIDNADFVLDTLIYDENIGGYAMQTQGVPAKEMGDTLYLRLYATTEDGTVIYGRLVPYSAKTFATNVLRRASASEALKNTVVALMNYGAEAQILFSYNTENLMNADIPAEYQEKQVAYSADLLNGLKKAESGKVGSLVATEGAFNGMSAQVTLDGALSINFLFLPGKTVDEGKVTMYYWNAETYASVDELTVENANGFVDTTMNGSYYQGIYAGIAAKDIDKTVYVMAVYQSEGETCMSGIVSYSIEQFCRSQASRGTVNAPMCEALTVYSYYAKLYLLGV